MSLKSWILHGVHRMNGMAARSDLPEPGADADGGEEEAVALGDRQVQAHVAGDEVFELVAHGSDQHAIGAQVLSAGQLRGQRFRWCRLECRFTLGQVGAAGDPLHAMHVVEDPGLERHGVFPFEAQFRQFRQFR